MAQKKQPKGKSSKRRNYIAARMKDYDEKYKFIQNKRNPKQKTNGDWQ
jgi:hypothetical protein